MVKTAQYTPTGEDFVSKGQYDKLFFEYQYVKQQLAELQRMVFGSKSERFVPSDDTQLSLFGEETTPKPQPGMEEISYTRGKRHKKEKGKAVRAKLPPHLPRQEEIIEPDGLEEGSRKIGEEITEILEYNPAKVYVRKIVRPKYAKPGNEGVTVAELPTLPIPKGNAGASMLAFILVSKFIDHLPYYRQIQILQRQGLTLSDSTFNGWFNAATDLLEPLYVHLARQVQGEDYIQADESPIGVQDSHKKGTLHKGYHWIYRSPIKQTVLFKYHHGRGHGAPEAFLGAFSGTLQTDGYIAYDAIARKNKMTHLACMAHARRKFDKALGNDAKRAGFILKKMQLLYDMERNCRERDVGFDIRKRYRQRFAKPILDAIKKWLIQNTAEVLPSSSIGKAIAYTLNLWDRLSSYIDDGRYEIDNNLIENAIRPLALGRKNYLFAGSHDAARRAAMMYSFFATCKVNDVEPLAWLTDVLSRIQDHKANRLSELLPRNWKDRVTLQ